MHIACRQGLFDIACYLVNNAAANVSGENSAGETPLNISNSSDKTDASILRRFILRSIDLQNEAAEAQYFVITGLNDMTELESLKKSSKMLQERKNSLNNSPNKVDSNVEYDSSSKNQIEKHIETIEKQRIETEEMENAKISVVKHISHLQNEIENINIQFFEVTESKAAADSSIADFSNEIVVANNKLDELANQKIVLERHVIDTQIQVDKMKIESDELENTKNILAERYIILQTEGDREKAQLNLLCLGNNRMDNHLGELNEQILMKKEENIVKIKILTEELM
jgi:chromosome segregation ATPase